MFFEPWPITTRWSRGGQAQSKYILLYTCIYYYILLLCIYTVMSQGLCTVPPTFLPFCSVHCARDWWVCVPWTSNRSAFLVWSLTESLFDKWINSCKASDYDSLNELILIEEFQRWLPDCIVLYLNEKKVASFASAAVLADEYIFSLSVSKEKYSAPVCQVAQPNHPQSLPNETRKCS